MIAHGLGAKDKLFGAACWLIGNVLWLTGQPLFQLVEWWIAFLVLTIAGSGWN